MGRPMGRYAGKIKVVGPDLMCFPVNPETLEATGGSCYDAYAITDPETEPAETISFGTWCRRLNDKWNREQEQERQHRKEAWHAHR